MATDDDEMTFSHLLHGASSCQEDNDESSVDIYDDLDSTPVAPSNSSTKVIPDGDNLNLFDEILIEEGAAKQASYNELQAEYEKCQQQLQELMKKLQEIQKQNSTLQNENQSLKKNISALIKTARVEINRKDEEISALQRRLPQTPVYHNTSTRTYFPAPTYHTKNVGASKSKYESRDLLPENNQEMDFRTKQALPKDIPQGYTSREVENKKRHSEKGAAPYIPPSDPEELYSNGDHSNLANVDKEEKKEVKCNEHHSKEKEHKYKTKAQQNPESTSDGLLNAHGKLHVNSEKTVRNGLWKDGKGLNIKCSPNAEKQSGIIPSREKQSTSTDRLLPKTGHCSDDGSKKSNINQKDFDTQSKEERNSAQKIRQLDRYLEPQGSAVFSERNAVAKSLQKLSKSCVDERKIKVSNCRRNEGRSNHGIHGGFSDPAPPAFNRELKHGHLKEESSKYEHIHSKPDRHRTEEKRKSERDGPRESRSSQNGRRGSKETSQKTARRVTKKEGRSKREEDKFLRSEKTDKSVGDMEEPMSTKAGRAEEQNKSKDLKLSFMQTLNLTLSPAKKQTDNSVAKVCDIEIQSQKVLLASREERKKNEAQLCTSSAPPEPITSHTTKQTKITLLPNHDHPAQTNMEKITSVSEAKMQVKNEGLAEALKPCKMLPSPEDTAEQYKMALNAKTEREESPMDPDSPFNDLETISSVDFDSLSVIDEIHGSDSDSSMEEGESGNCKNKTLVPLEKESEPVPCTDIADKGKITNDGVPIVNQRAHNLKPSFPEDGSLLELLRHQELNPTSQPRDTNPVSVDDDNSILSIDLNQMRCIPKVISPLNSPIRPLTKPLRMESPYKGPVKSHNTDFVPEGRNQSSELNKENEKPLSTDHRVLEVSQLNMSSEELEEGEIVSDSDEPKIGQSSESSKKSKRKTSPDRSNLSKNTSNHKVRSTPSSEDAGKLGPGKKGKGKTHEETMMSSKEMKKNKAVSIDYLERIVQITIKPATLHEFMHMLKAIRKQMRKSYMKFKIHFPVQHFHRIIDSAVVNFTSLVKYLDFSKMAKSSETLKLNLCEVIESKLNQIKKNSVIEHLFKQQQSDMKKKLWKLVEEQLDYLFDKIKKMLLKLCNLVNFGNESNETKLDKRTKENPKCLPSHKSERSKLKKLALNIRTRKHDDSVLPNPGNQHSKGGYHDANKMDTHKNMATKCKPTDNAKHSQTELFKEKSKQDTTLKGGKYEKEELHMVGDHHKSDVSSGPLTEQQMSGLTFNLVNDAQMGEMFKSLLQGSADLSEKSVDFIDENQWEFRTPEKHTVEGGHNGEDEPAYEAEESIQKETPLESKVLDDIKWPTVSSKRDSLFLARLQMPIDPAILDESCMFEIPNSPALKKGEACTSDKPKSLVSSILLEDLAVSLTIPSPLKSDAHLSFLKPEVLGSVPEDVLNAHLSEDAHLDEEDASEQDIHLALESDNSSGKSSCSSSWAGLPPAPGFQYCPNLPMQAVIMEKSNDHFIVKIRRAAPSTSPVLDQVILGNEPLTCLTERGKCEITSEEKIDTLNFKSVQLEDVTASTDNVNIRGNAPIGKEQVPNSQGCTEEVSKCLEKVQEPAQSETQQDFHPHASDDALEKSLFSNVRQKQPCDMPEFLQESCINSSNLSPDLPGPHLELGSGVGSEEVSSLQNTSKERKESFLSLKESSSKTIQQEDIPEVFKLPQTLTFPPQNDIQYTKEQCSLVNSESIALVEDLSSKSHFDKCIDVTEETPMENEVDSWDLKVESALNGRTESAYKNKVEQKMNGKDHCEAGRSSEDAIEAVMNLAEQLLDNSVDENENLETKPVLSIHDQGCQTSLKVSKKRKREAEGATSTKRHRNESNDLTCKKNGKSNKKSKETNSVSTSASSKNNSSDSGKYPFLSSSVSPSSLRAKNIVKRKGEVLISWTRNDDREILLECQKKGPSGEIFASVAARLNKSPTQVEERFKQLVKLFEMSNYS